MVTLVVTMCLPYIMADTFLGGPSTTFVGGLNHRTVPSSVWVRGGDATTATDNQDDIEIESSEDEAEEEESNDEEEEEEEGLDAKLVKSAQTKAATVKTKIAKAAVQAAIASTVQPKVKKSSSRSSNSLLKLLHIPYIVRACLNPFTVLKMTRAYFASLVQLDYLNDNDSSKDLRSALQEKAKNSGGGGASPRGKRKFKPGKAKTLSDLPVLNT